jgi:hypothetical protein
MDLSGSRVGQSREVGQYVRDQPLTSLAIATAAGFVLGGGMNRRVCIAMLTVAARIAFRGAASSLIVGMITGRQHESTRHHSGRNDNGRTNLQEPG